jgi:MFS family permease
MPYYIKNFGGAPALAGILMSSFALGQFFAAEALGLGPAERGWLLAYVGALAKRFDERNLAATALSITAVSRVLYSPAPSVPMLVMALLPLSLGSGVAGTTLRTLLTQSVPRESVGGRLGLASSIDSINRILAPCAWR